MQQPQTPNRGAGDKRHDFGPSLTVKHCKMCQATVYNRGCKSCGARYCKDCWTGHGCQECGDPLSDTMLSAASHPVSPKKTGESLAEFLGEAAHPDTTPDARPRLAGAGDANVPPAFSAIPEESLRSASPVQSGFRVPTQSMAKTVIMAKTPSEFAGKRPSALVFKGGGAKGISYSGAIKRLEQAQLIQGVTKFAGTSAGSQIAALLAFGYNGEELEALNRKAPWNKLLDYASGPCMPCLNVARLFQAYGFCKGQTLTDFLDEAFEAKTHIRRCTFQELFEHTGNELRIGACNLATRQFQFLDHHSHPDMPVSIACKASSAIPIVFQPVPWASNDGNRSLFVDGGLEGNLPISAFHHSKEETVLALNLVCTESTQTVTGKPKSFAQFLMVAVSMLRESAQGIHGVDSLLQTGQALRDEGVDVINIDTGKFSALHTDVRPKDFDNLVQAGWTAVDFYLNKPKWEHEANMVRKFNGFVEHAYRLLFAFENTFSSSPKLMTILPTGTVENEKILQPEAERGFLAYSHKQDVSEAIAQKFLDTPFVWKRDDGTFGLMQIWPTRFNDKFKSEFEYVKYPQNPDSVHFVPEAVEEFKRTAQKMFGEAPAGIHHNDPPIYFCHKRTPNRKPVYCGTGAQLMALLRLNDDIREELNIISITEPDGFVCKYVNGQGEEGQKDFRMTLSEKYTLYTKQGWETMACVKLRHQFDNEATLGAEDVSAIPITTEEFQLASAVTKFQGFIENAHRDTSNDTPVYCGLGSELLALLKSRPDIRTDLGLISVQRDGFSCSIVDSKGDVTHADFSLAPNTDYVLYTKVGNKTMACVTSRGQFDIEATLLAEDLSFLSPERRMIKLIQELSDEKNCFETYAHLQHELLHRVKQENDLRKDPAEQKEFLEKQDSVFDRVEQHKQNGENKLDLYAEQFKLVHGVDHQTFTEKWLFENTHEDIQLETVLENPTFDDFVGVYDIQPRSAYVASKMIIDASDFMGVFDLGSASSQQGAKQGTFHGVATAGKTDVQEMDEQSAEGVKRRLSAHQQAKQKVDEGKADVSSPANKNGSRAPEPAGQCCGSDAAVRPHFLGEGQYLQYRLRRENVIQYMDNSLISKRLKELIPEDPKEPIYVFTASSNGIMRFHPWGGVQRKLWHGYGDSEKAEKFPMNIAHAGQYGCFCFGVIYRERENYTDRFGKVQRGGRTIVMRYNRWATDNAPIYAMMRQRADERDTHVPDQESLLAHYEHLLKNRLAIGSGDKH